MTPIEAYLQAEKAKAGWKQFFKLTVNMEGLELNKRFISWQEVEGMYTLISDNRLAAIIEQYKNSKT